MEHRQKRDLTPKEYTCFVSHKQSDGNDLARIIQRDLKKHNIPAFVDFDVVKTGSIKRNVLEQAIIKSEYFIFIITDQYMHSLSNSDVQYCRHELEWALKHKPLDKIIPILHKDCSHETLIKEFQSVVPEQLHRAFEPLAVQDERNNLSQIALCLRLIRSRLGHS
mmetsp:Transcript_24081/g.29162  ORF Transcript_24081/g.29162 Transcript_24081/m.29162 type:complete len:165 (+) Transcript_24081:332-826(+)